MGCIFSTRAERKKRRKRRGNIQVQPIGDGTEMVMSRTDFSIFRVKNSGNAENCKDVPSARGVTLETLDEKCDGVLIYKMTGVAAKGVAFEICEEGKAVVAPPPRLLQLKLKDSGKVKETSVDEIKERLFQAERRRKQLEDERVLKVRKMIKTESPETVKSYIEERKKLEDVQIKKMDDAVASRQQRLRYIRDRLRERDGHAKTVRRNKKVNLDDMGEAPKYEKMYSFYTSHN